VLDVKCVFHISLPYSTSVETFFSKYFQVILKFHAETHIGINVKSSISSYLNQNFNVSANLNKRSHVKYQKFKPTSFTPPSVIKLYLFFVYAFTCFSFLVNHLQKAPQLCKGSYHYMIHNYIKLVPTDFHLQVKM
jgi:hypothetical protein